MPYKGIDSVRLVEFQERQRRYRDKGYCRFDFPQHLRRKVSWSRLCYINPHHAMSLIWWLRVHIAVSEIHNLFSCRIPIHPMLACVACPLTTQIAAQQRPGRRYRAGTRLLHEYHVLRIIVSFTSKGIAFFNEHSSLPSHV